MYFIIETIAECGEAVLILGFIGAVWSIQQYNRYTKNKNKNVYKINK